MVCCRSSDASAGSSPAPRPADQCVVVPGEPLLPVRRQRKSRHTTDPAADGAQPTLTVTVSTPPSAPVSAVVAAAGAGVQEPQRRRPLIDRDRHALSDSEAQSMGRSVVRCTGLVRSASSLGHALPRPAVTSLRQSRNDVTVTSSADVTVTSADDVTSHRPAEATCDQRLEERAEWRAGTSTKTTAIYSEPRDITRRRRRGDTATTETQRTTTSGDRANGDVTGRTSPQRASSGGVTAGEQQRQRHADDVDTLSSSSTSDDNYESVDYIRSQQRSTSPQQSRVRQVRLAVTCSHARHR